MDKPYYAMMNLGIVHPMAFPETIKGEGPVVETIRQIATDEFFGAIEVRRATSPEVLAEEKKIFAESGIEPIVAGQPPLLLGKLNLNALDDAERSAAVEDVKKSIDEAYELGAKICAILSGPDPGEEQREAAVEALAKSLVELAQYSASRAGDGEPVFVSLETFDYDIDKKCLMGPTKLAGQLMERVRGEVQNVGLTIDLSHLPLLRESVEECLGAAKDYLIHVHVGNAFTEKEDDPAYGDQHPRFGYPGSLNDVDDLRAFLKGLVDIGYFDKDLPTSKPVVTFEIKPVPGENPELVIAGTKRAFLEAWAAV